MTLCDIGNTTFAFKSKKRKFKLSIDSKLNSFPKIKGKIYFVSVNKKATNKFLTKYPQAINIKDLISFKTSYKGMGIDRQVACIGFKNAIIVDCGSAITVDIMKKAQHQGGFILSGIKNLINFYPQISPKLKFNFTKNINLDKMPMNTNEAISYAILKSVILPIKELEEKYNLQVVFTGEDSEIIRDNFKNSIYKKNLIFNSMKKIIKKENR